MAGDHGVPDPLPSQSESESHWHFDRWNGVLLLVRKDCANVKFTTCFDKTHPFTENTLSFPVQIENLTLAKSSCVRVKVLRSSDQHEIPESGIRNAGRRLIISVLFRGTENRPAKLLDSGFRNPDS